MIWQKWLLASVFALLCGACGILAQGEDRPSFSVPDPDKAISKAASQKPGDPFIIAAIDYDQAEEGRDRVSSALPELVQYFQKSTEIQTPVHWVERTLNDDRFKQAALLFMTGNEATFRFSDNSKKNLGEYLKGGGILFSEDIRPPIRSRRSTGAGTDGTPFDRQFKALIKEPLVLGSLGDRWYKVSKKHPLYSSYFAFEDGPPMVGARGGNVFELEMLQVRGRVAIIFSDLNISSLWGDLNAQGRDRNLQFGANLIVFAMAQRAAGGGPAPSIGP